MTRRRLGLLLDLASLAGLVIGLSVHMLLDLAAEARQLAADAAHHHDTNPKDTHDRP